MVTTVSITAQAADSARTADFYQGVASIDSRSDAARDQATRAALAQVLVRMTGDVSISLGEASQSILRDAPRYVRSFRFDQPAAPVSEDGQQQAPLKSRLIVDFDAQALTQALKTMRLPLWDELRPVTAVWVLKPNERGPRQLLSRERVDANLPSLATAARLRGVPLIYPVNDAMDRGFVSALDIVAQDTVRLASASERYAARHVLTLQLEQDERLWYANWAFLSDAAAPVVWKSYGSDANAAVQSGFDHYADLLAQRYVVRVTAGWVQTTRLRVIGLNRLEDYAHVLHHLEKLSLVQSVQPREILNGDVVFLVTFEGDLADLSRSIGVGGVLLEARAPTALESYQASFGGSQNQNQNQQNLGQPGLEQGPATSGELSAADTPMPDSAMVPEQPAVPSSGLNFFAVAQQPELRYRLRN